MPTESSLIRKFFSAAGVRRMLSSVGIQPRSGKLRLIVVTGFILLAALILPKDYVPRYSYEIGRSWVAPSLVADFDFAIFKPDEQVADEQRKALQQSPPVFVRDSAAARLSIYAVRDVIKRYVDGLRHYARVSEADPVQASLARDSLFAWGKASPDDLLALYPRLDDWQKKFQDVALGFRERVHAAGYLDTLKGQFAQELIYVAETPNHLEQKELVLEAADLPEFFLQSEQGLSPLEQALFRAIVLPVLKPNLRFDKAATLQEQDRVKALISPVYDKVKAGQVIIAKGERVTQIDDQRIKSYLRATDERFGRPAFWVTFAGQLVVVSFLAILLVLFMRNNRPRIFFNDRKLMLVMLVFLTMAAVVVLVLKLTLFTREVAGLNYIFLVPACMLPIILSAFFDSRFAFFGNIIIAVFGGAIVPNGFEYFFIQLCAGTAAVYSLTRLRNRADFFISLSIILVTYMVTYIGYSFYSRGNLTQIQYSNLALFGLNVILTLITYPLIYIFEKIFGLTSDLTFVELLDTNHPLLKELSVRAPGTFQHSLQVANITEAVLNRIGGNSLQAKVGALFHDIGKMEHPLYFIENLADHPNPHDQINFSESAEMIIRHVSDGVELAHEHNLPAEVIDYIRTHHGTTRVEFFYRMQVESHPDDDVDPAAFSYPGPLPYTREMAVLMISDSIEAASRAMKDKSPEKLLALVENVVDSKVRQRQFAKAYLTFKDLEDAKHVIYNMLVSIYHGRIEYPGAQPDLAIQRAEDARDSD